MSSEAISIDIRIDGIYLVLDKTISETPITRGQVVSFLEEYGIRDIDFRAVSDIFNMSEDKIQQKISSNTTIVREPELIKVQVSKDKMQAYISFIPSKNGGVKADLDQVMMSLATEYIKAGIDEKLIAYAVQEHSYTEKYLIAQGTLPVHQKDGYLEFFFDKEKKSGKPKLLEDGRVDFHSLNLIEIVNKGDLLIRVHEPEGGENGIDVFGNILEFKKGKPPAVVIRSKGVDSNELASEFYATVSGQVIFKDRKLSVLPMLEIDGNVDNTTGDINFNGSVIIGGIVRTGFSVTASGNIEIYGVVEGAKIKSGENIFLYNGVQGNDIASIEAEGNITAKYVYSSNLKSGRDIVADSIMHSNVICNGSIILMDKKGLLVGGKVLVNQKVEAKIIGSPMATATEISIGNSNELITEYDVLVSVIKSTQAEYEKIDKIVESLTAMGKTKPLSEDKKAMLLKSIHTKSFLRDRLKATQEKLDFILPTLSVSKGVIIAHDVLHSGVKAQVGNAVIYIRDDIRKCTLRNKDGKVVIGVADDV